MTVRSARHRSARRRAFRSLRERPASSGIPAVYVGLRDVDGVWQSFLISAGQSQQVTLVGYRDRSGDLERYLLPVVITARMV